MDSSFRVFFHLQAVLYFHSKFINYIFMAWKYSTWLDAEAKSLGKVNIIIPQSLLLEGISTATKEFHKLKQWNFRFDSDLKYLGVCSWVFVKSTTGSTYMCCILANFTKHSVILVALHFHRLTQGHSQCSKYCAPKWQFLFSWCIPVGIRKLISSWGKTWTFWDT